MDIYGKYGQENMGKINQMNDYYVIFVAERTWIKRIVCSMGVLPFGKTKAN
jgi:hypothetical protein